MTFSDSSSLTRSVYPIAVCLKLYRVIGTSNSSLNATIFSILSHLNCKNKCRSTHILKVSRERKISFLLDQTAIKPHHKTKYTSNGRAKPTKAIPASHVKRKSAQGIMNNEYPKTIGNKYFLFEEINSNDSGFLECSSNSTIMLLYFCSFLNQFSFYFF